MAGHQPGGRSIGFGPRGPFSGLGRRLSRRDTPAIEPKAPTTAHSAPSLFAQPAACSLATQPKELLADPALERHVHAVTCGPSHAAPLRRGAVEVVEISAFTRRVDVFEPYQSTLAPFPLVVSTWPPSATRWTRTQPSPTATLMASQTAQPTPAKPIQGRPATSLLTRDQVLTSRGGHRAHQRRRGRGRAARSEDSDELRCVRRP